MKQTLLFFFSFIVYVTTTWAQTPISLPATPPYVQNFNTTPGVSGTSYPDGWFSYNDTTIDNTMTIGSNASTTGANYNYNSRIGVLGSGSNFDPGSIVLAIDNTSGLSSLQISYDVIKIREQSPRDCSFHLEYSTTSPTSGFSTVVGGLYFSGSLAQGTVSSYTNLDLSAIDNQGGTVYLRWAYATVSGGGSRDGIALDNVSITWSTTPPTIDFNFLNAGDPNIAQGSSDNLIFQTIATVTNGSAILNQVTLTTNGDYQASDIAANGFKLWFSSDSDFDPLVDTQLGLASSTTGNGETLTFSSLSQFIPSSSVGYIFLAVDTSPSSVIGRTIGITTTTEADFTFASPNNKNAASGSGSLHTIVGLQTGAVATSMCVSTTEGQTLSVPFTYQPISIYGSATFTAQLSDETGDFSSPTMIGSISSDGTGSQTINATIPANTTNGTAYRIRVVSTNPDIDGADNGVDISISLLNLTISPSAVQNIEAFQQGNTLTAIELNGSVQSRRWKYSTTSSGPYTEFLGSNSTEIPYFETAGTYYMVCETVFDCGKTLISNEVQINVSPFVGTRLFPGDVVIVAWDAAIGSSDDDFALANLVELTQGTKFQVVNATFENGTAANTRTHQWQGTTIMEFTYKSATPLSAGSIISFELPSNLTNPAANVRINGTPVASTVLEGVRLSSSETGSGGVNVSTSNADQIFITQGKFNGTDFDGYVLFGMTNDADWIDFSVNVSTARTSRLHPNILCLNTTHPTGVAGSYFDLSALHTGTQPQLLAEIINMSNWIDITTTAATLPAATHTTTFSVTPSGVVQVEWIGGGSISTGDNWFDCINWENLYVPDRRQDVIMTTSAVDGSRINASADFSDEYQDIAEVRNIIIENQTLYIFDDRNAKLDVYKDLRIRNTGFLDMEDNVTFVDDGVIELRGDWYNEIGTLAFDEGESLIIFSGGNSQSITTTGGTESFFDVILNCGKELTLNNDIIISNSFDGLSTSGGVLKFVSGNIFSSSSYPATYSVTFETEATHTGANASRHIRGAARRISNKIEDFVFPVGKDGIYRPLTLHTQADGNLASTFFCEYFFQGYGTYQPVVSPLAFVSQLEHWMLNREVGNRNAELTLSWGEESLVTNMASLVVAHWTDANEWVSRGNSLTTGTTASGTIRSAEVITQFSPFTLGSIDFTNILPLTWLSFDAKYLQEQNSVMLNWATTNEESDAYFTIERSYNGDDFVQIGSLNTSAHRQSDINSYQFADTEPLVGRCYYRVKQINLNGKVNCSAVKNILINTTLGIQVFSHQKALFLQANLDKTTSAKLYIYSLDGKKLAHYDLMLKAGKVCQQIPLRLSNAVYVYKIALENQSELMSGKFLIK